MNRAANPRRVATRSSKVNDENAVPVRAGDKGAPSRLGPKVGAVQQQQQPSKAGKALDNAKAGIKRERNVLGAVTNIRDNADDVKKPAKAAVKAEARPPLATRPSQTQQARPIAPVPHRITKPTVYSNLDRNAVAADDELIRSEMDLDKLAPALADDMLDMDDEATLGAMTDDSMDDEEEYDDEDWLRMTEEDEYAAHAELDMVRKSFQDDIDLFDTTMVAEYADDIFAHMEELEVATMPNPRYMEFQTEIEWTMRTTLIDWLLQVHLRYHMLPETLWIAVNLVDRFLSVRVVSLNKLQLVGVTAMFIAAKYEEILAPSVDEFVYMTENGYSKEEILKGERIILQTLDFTISSYCSPYSWVRRISKADDYDIQTRTLSKFLMEVTLLDHRFLRCKPSMIAAVGMYLARKMLGGDWNEAFVFYSNFTESQLVSAAIMLCERLVESGFEKVYVYKKYSNKKFLRASTFACDWAHNHAATTWSPRE
ncbi:B-type cyclin [Vanrija albida]|uniref:B-type cyclin n=1 Tax=Vanrija albida TaxID=181172 RepID=A0ABR3Q1X6_9TREE